MTNTPLIRLLRFELVNWGDGLHQHYSKASLLVFLKRWISGVSLYMFMFRCDDFYSVALTRQ